MILDILAYAVLWIIAGFVLGGIVSYIITHWDEVGGVVVFVSIIVVALLALLRVI